MSAGTPVQALVVYGTVRRPAAGRPITGTRRLFGQGHCLVRLRRAHLFPVASSRLYAGGGWGDCRYYEPEAYLRACNL
ncbi:MAG TPA: hypothetical protein ENN44_01175 [Methanoculleus sp.]|nr:hypothetical protein [Methanoculleus sp.]